ncbi:MAG: hypothetical protein M3T55_05330, partial [Pseudomonadota bacterium]|nr:hypothetical protein [Pseudomonadota bacterium]
YEWRGPVEASPPQIAAEPEIDAASVVSMTTSPPPLPPEPAAPTVTPGPATAEQDIWVELDAAPEKPAKARRPRARGRSKAESAPSEAKPVEPASEVVTEVEIDAAPLSSPAEVIVLATANEPPAPAKPDPAEIQTAPAAPKRGWWRRGA